MFSALGVAIKIGIKGLHVCTCNEGVILILVCVNLRLFMRTKFVDKVKETFPDLQGKHVSEFVMPQRDFIRGFCGVAGY